MAVTGPLDRVKVTEHLADLGRRIEALGELRELLSTAESDAYREGARLESQREEFRRLAEAHGLTPDPVEELRAAVAAVLEAADHAFQVRVGDPVTGELRAALPWPVLEVLRKAAQE